MSRVQTAEIFIVLLPEAFATRQVIACQISVKQLPKGALW